MKLSLFAVDTIFFIENSKDSTKKKYPNRTNNLISFIIQNKHT